MNSESHPNDTTAAAVTNSTDLTAAEGKDDWLNDPRIAYNQQTQKWIFEDPDNGKEYEYDSELGQWIDTTNANSDGNDKEEENKDDPDAENTKKRKLQEEADLAELADQVGPDSTTASKAGSNSNSNKQKNKRAKHDQAKETDAPKKTKPNKAIYISGLPKDVSAQELDQVFSKYGIIADDLNAVSDKKDNDYTGKRIKIYRDKQTGEPKGDALIVYFKPESVQLAIEMIDGSELRAGSGELIKVQPAEFNNDNSTNKNNSGAAEKSGTAGAPALNGQKKHLLQKHYEKLNHKLADWGDDDNLAGSSSTANKRWEKTVILKNVFTAAELTEDPLAASEIREDIIAGCEEGAGPVSSAVLFEHDPAGVVSVKFEDREDARRCVELMNGRFFAGHRLTAEIYDGRERFQRKKKDTDDTGSTDEGKRLEEFGNWLEKEGCPLGNPANYPFATIEPEEARVIVPSPRFDKLCDIYKPASKVPAHITVYDIAGLTKGASQGEGLGNAFLSNIRAVDAIFQVVRCFDDAEIIHIEGDVNPVRDLQIILDELRIKDIEFAKKHLESVEKVVKRGGQSLEVKNKKDEAAFVDRLIKYLEEGKRIANGTWTTKEVEIINSMFLLTAKPCIYLVNLSERDYIRKKNKHLLSIKQWVDANSPGDLIIPFSVCLEERLSHMETDEEREEELKKLGVQSALPKIITTMRSALHLCSYFTCGADEVREWTIREGTKAPQAAGVIHNDLMNTFILAQVTKYQDLVELGDETAVKANGKLMQKGKEYVVEDGDIIYFRSGAGKN